MIQMLMQGTSLTKQEQKCKLYDEFDKFAYRKEETLRDHYLRFSLLLNDMNMYNMKLEQFQVNTKFLNTLPLEWSKFVTDVKLVRDLHTTNVDQLHAYLGQHEYHANEVRLMHEQTSDQLALISQHQLNRTPYQHHQQSYHQPLFQQQASAYQTSLYATSYHTPQFVSQGSSLSNMSISYPMNDISSTVNQNAFMASSLAPQIDYDPIAQNPSEFSSPESRHMVPVFQRGRQSSMSAGSSRPFASGSGGASGKQRVIVCYNCKCEGHMSKQYTKPKRKQDAEWFKDKNSTLPALHDDLILYVIEQLKTQVVNCIKINQDNKHVNELLTAKIERELALEKKVKELNNIVFKRSQSAQTVHMLTKPQVFYNYSTRQALGFQNLCYLKKAQQLKPKLYDGSMIKKSDAIVIPDTEETLMLAEESRSKMIEKQNDPQMTEKKVITKPIDYAIKNQLSTYFETRFVPQTEVFTEQAFWSKYSVQTDEPNLFACTTIVEVPKELPKVNMVNSCLKKLKFHLASFDMVVKERTTTTAITEGTWGFEHTKACFRDDIIPFVKALKELFTSFDQCLIDEVTEVQNVFKQMELAAISVDIVNLVLISNVNVDCLNVDAVSALLEVDDQNKIEIYQRNTLFSPDSALTFVVFFEINDLKAQVQEKDTVILKLKETLHSLNGDVNERNVKREVQKMETLNIELDHKVDVAPLALKLRKNRIARTDYIRHTQEKAATLREIIERNKLVAVTPKNKTKHIRLTKQITKSRKTTVTPTPSANIDSNIHVLSFTRVILVSSGSGSMSQDNTKKNRIRRTQRKAKKNKLEDHLRTISSSLNKKNVVATSFVGNSVSNMNSDLKCASCNGCLFFDNHDACVVDYINSVNASLKSKSVKKQVVQIVLWYLESDCSKHMTGDRSQLVNFVQKFLGTVKFGNDLVVKIMGYGDYQIGNVTISRVYYVEGLGHNLFSVGQYCDSDLEVAFRQHTCFIRNLDRVDLLMGYRGNNLYTRSLQDMMASSPICLLSKASKTKSWLWHHRFSHSKTS
nr:integrase, catalytic region, zinc finger, CCHC-type, peptidase aspartic, catalytic [Tanacetum cinerariifolium]